MQRAEQLLNIQYGVTQALSGASSIADASRRVLAEVCGGLGWPVGGLWLVDERSGALRCHGLWRASTTTASTFVKDSRASSFSLGVGLPGRVWSQREPVWIRDVTSDENFPRAASAAQDGLRSAFAVPVQSGERFLGVLEFFAQEIRAPDRDLLRLFASIASQTGQAIERIETEERLRAAAARLRGIADSTLDSIITISADGHIVDWNRQAEALLGWSRDDVVGRTLTKILPERYRETYRTGLQCFVASGDASLLDQRVEIEALHRNGQEIPIEIAITAVREGSGVVFSAFLRDITERKRLRFLAEAGAILATSLDYEATLARIAQLALPSLADYCFIDLAEASGRIRRVAMVFADPALNARWRILLGRLETAHEPDHPVADVIRTAQVVVFEPLRKGDVAALARSPEHYHFLRQIRLRSWMAVPLVARGETVGAMGFGRRGGERRWTPEDLQLAEDIAHRAALAVANARLYGEAREAVRTRDEFLSTISHDLRNPLAAVKGLSQLLRRRIDRSGAPELRPFAEPLARIDAAATTMTSILDELVEVSGLRIGQPLEIARSPVDLVGLAGEVAKMFAHGDRHSIEVEARVPTLVASVDPGRMARVLGNLVTNAIKYSPTGGRVRIALSTVDSDAIISVSDDGLGIPQADLPHVFERYRRGSNVPVSIGGTGIGLTAAKQVVELHGGSIDVESAVGRGSTFTVRLPLGHVEVDEAEGDAQLES